VTNVQGATVTSNLVNLQCCTPCGRTSRMVQAGKRYLSYYGHQLHWHLQASASGPLQGIDCIAKSCTAYVGCMVSSLRDGTAAVRG
jgi:hypothetical protein